MTASAPASAYTAPKAYVRDPAHCEAHDSDSCTVCPGPTKTKARGKTETTRFRNALDVMRDPPPDPVLEGVLYRGRKTLLAAESGAGKSFLFYSWAGAFSDPNVYAWAGLECVSGSVAYFAWEPDASGTRLRALAEQGVDVSNIYILNASDPISPLVRDGVEVPSPGEVAARSDLAGLVAELEIRERPSIVAMFFDTVRAGMAGAEESSRDVSAYLRSVDRIASVVPRAAVGLAHHMGWQDSPDTSRKRERGSSAFRGNVDLSLLLEKDSDEDPAIVQLTLRCLKNRDGERVRPLALLRRRVDLGTDHKGRLLSSCVVEADRDSHDARHTTQEARRDDQDVLAVLRVVRDHPESATNGTNIRSRLGIAKPRADSAIRLALSRNYMVEGKRGCPYTLLPAGIEAVS